MPFLIAGCVVGGILIFLFFITLICFLLVFYSPKRKAPSPDEYPTPKGKIYDEFREDMVRWIKEGRAEKHEKVEIKSNDGLTLRGKYYEYKKGAPVEILFHGYRGESERDLSGAMQRCFALGMNALIVDQRASGRSDGHIITFGIREREDCRLWAEYASRRFGKETKIILTGISMGAATVMMALLEPLPENVVGVLADCGYTSPREIIQKVMRDIHIPPWLLYPFISLGARIFGGFSLEDASATEGCKRTKIPVIFIHGVADDFVPCDMSRSLFEACTSPKKRLFTVEGAGHGLAYPKDRDGYLAAVGEFFSSILTE
jgi:fermentation-respiration switch protein FrsA (DUF1100 family)